MASVSLSIWVAIAALLLSLYSVWKTVQFNRKREESIESQRRLNALLTEREAAEAAEGKRADLGAWFSKIVSQFRLKIFNRGQATARNVRASFPERNQIVLNDNVARKFPLETLERHHSVELLAVPSMTGPSKLVVRLDWTDDEESDKSKTVYPTV